MHVWCIYICGVYVHYIFVYMYVYDVYITLCMYVYRKLCYILWNLLKNCNKKCRGLDAGLERQKHEYIPEPSSDFICPLQIFQMLSVFISNSNWGIYFSVLPNTVVVPSSCKLYFLSFIINVCSSTNWLTTKFSLF